MADAADGMHPTGMHSCYCPQQSWGKVMFLHVCVILFTGDVRGCLEGMHDWGVCMVAWGGGCAWLPGGVHGCWGACMVVGGHVWLLGGMHGCWGDMYGFQAGMYGCQGACVVARRVCGCRGVCIGYDEIQSMSRQYASYWNAFLFKIKLLVVSGTQCNWFNRGIGYLVVNILCLSKHSSK